MKPMNEWTNEELWNNIWHVVHNPPEHAGPEPVVRGLFTELLRRERERCKAAVWAVGNSYYKAGRISESLVVSEAMVAIEELT